MTRQFLNRVQFSIHVILIINYILNKFPSLREEVGDGWVGVVIFSISQQCVVSINGNNGYKSRISLLIISPINYV